MVFIAFQKLSSKFAMVFSKCNNAFNNMDWFLEGSLLEYDKK